MRATNETERIKDVVSSFQVEECICRDNYGDHHRRNYFRDYLFIFRSICVAKSANLVSSTVSSSSCEKQQVDAVNYDHHENPIKPDSR